MKGQAVDWFAKFFIAGFIVNLLLGYAIGCIAVVAQLPSLWAIADLFFDFALLLTIIFRGPALVKS
jgi:hypothetical protein